MEWIRQVWRENTSFVIGARTEAFNAPTGRIFAEFLKVTKNAIHTQTWFLDAVVWIGHVWRENTSFVIGARTGAFNAPRGTFSRRFLKLTKT